VILAEIRDRLNRQWNLHSAKMDWPGMETVLVGILNNEGILPETRLALCKEAIDAFTKRGYFVGKSVAAQQHS
jgi:hypothetical protein